MPISQEAIDRFLHAPPAFLPPFKGADPDQLRRQIYDCTGRHFRPVTEPRPHQLEGIAFALYQRRSLLYYSMRLGKSLMALQFAEQLKIAGIWKGKGLIICHAPIALDVWVSEAELHSRLKVYPVRNQIEELIEALESDCDLIVIPWSGLQNIFSTKRQNRKGQNKLYPDLAAARDAALGFSLAVIDEIHSAKNHTTLRFRLARELVRNCQFRLGLSGTPFGRNPYDIWAQACLIDDGKTLGFSYPFFEVAFGQKTRNRYSKKDEYVFDKRKQALLETKLASLALSYRLEECQRVEVWPGVVNLRLTGDQNVAYQEAIDRIVNLPDRQEQEIRSIFVRLRQISSGYMPFTDAFGNELIHRFKSNAKLEWLQSFIPAVADTGASWVIFHEFTESGKLICEALTEAKVPHEWLHGATKDKTLAVRRFQSRQVQAIVVQSATGSLAIDLHLADVMTFFEGPVSPIIRAQAEARPLASARGNRPLLLDDLTCSGVERKILQYTRSGRDLMSEIVHERKGLRETGGKNGRNLRREAGGV